MKKTHSSLTVLSLALAVPASAQVTVDGSITGDSYGSARSVQTVETQFGDNLSEWNAAYATIDSGRLYLALTGNLEDNFNKLEILIDSQAGGENVYSGLPGNDNTANMTGFTLDAGFDADYHVTVRRGFFGTPLFDVDIAVLGTATFSNHGDVFGGANEGAGTTGTGPANASPIEVAYDNSNTAGIIGGIAAADQAAALAVTTGFEMSIALSDIGNPAPGDIKIMVFQNNQDHNFASNQFLAGLQAPQGNLGGDGAGGFSGVLDFDMNALPGEQFFTLISAPVSVGTNYCLSTPNSTGTAAISATGSASIAANDLTLSVSTVPNQPGIFYYGPNQIQLVFGNGFRCVGGIVVRLNPPSNAVGNVATRVVNVLGEGIVPGTLNFQYWHRDPAGGGAFFNLSDGLEIVFVP